MEGDMTDPKYRPHPLVERLAGEAGEAGAAKLLGYFGSTSNGVVKVYPSLDDLSVYYEISEDDIVNVEEASAEELPHGGSAIWVKANARVERCVNQRVSVEARFLGGGIAGYMAKGPAVTYRAAAPLALEPETARGPACEYSKVWPCSVVVGVCLASNDMPCPYTEQYWCPGEVATAVSCFTCAGYTCVAECYSAGCPPTQRYCTGGLFTRCGCEVYSAVRCR
jgi:hypothetical protein